MSQEFYRSWLEETKQEIDLFEEVEKILKDLKGQTKVDEAMVTKIFLEAEHNRSQRRKLMTTKVKSNEV